MEKRVGSRTISMEQSGGLFPAGQGPGRSIRGEAGIRLVSGSERLDAHAFYRKCGYTGDKQQINFKKKLRS